MLSDREREALNELERQLKREAPGLARKLRKSASPTPRSRSLLLDLTIGLSILLAAVAILLGLIASAVGFGALAAFLVLLRFLRR
jgi:hypothetical protein